MNPSILHSPTHVSRYMESSSESGESVTQVVAGAPLCLDGPEGDFPVYYHYFRYEDPDGNSGVHVKNLAQDEKGEGSVGWSGRGRLIAIALPLYLFLC